MELATTRAHQRGRYAGKKSGQERLAGRTADRNKFIMQGAWLRSKEMEEIIMKLSMKEKKILYTFACPSHDNTVTRLKWLMALTVDPEAKRWMLGLPGRWRRR